MVSSQSFAGYEEKNQSITINSNLNTFKRNSIPVNNINFQISNGNRIKMISINHKTDFYFRTLLRYIRSGGYDNFNEKVIMNYDLLKIFILLFFFQLNKFIIIYLNRLSFY
jgi:hypothetical protein